MNDIVYTKSYTEYRNELLQELSNASESFVRIGYLLKVARDTEVLSGQYENYIDFAREEFGLDKTQVSRFIRINDRFSVDGNSLELKDEYKGFGTRKLGIMIQLPDEITEELTSDYTVEEIETIKNEVKEEQKVTPLEDFMERQQAKEENNKAAVLAEEDILEAAVFEIGKAYPEIFKDIMKHRDALEPQKILAPISEQMYIVRIMGVGKMMLICKESEVALVNARTNEKEIREWDDVKVAITNILSKYSAWQGTAKENYFNFYGIELEEEKVAPVQQKKVHTEVKDAKKDKASPKKPSVVSKPVERTEPDIQSGDSEDTASRDTGENAETGDGLRDTEQTSDSEEDFINRPGNQRDSVGKQESAGEITVSDDGEREAPEVLQRINEMRTDLVWKVGQLEGLFKEENYTEARNKLHAIKELVSVMLRELEKEDE